MKTQSLEAHGVPAEMIEIWRRYIGEELTAVQARAVLEGVLAGQSLLVQAPTSSGKTLTGEMATSRAAKEGKKVIFAPPLKSVVEEKYRDFQVRYGEALGLQIVASHRDRRDFDGAIEDGRYDIAVVVFEKLQRLLVSRPALLDGVGLVVVDELQVLADRHRGPGLEILLTHLRNAESRPQFVGLSAVLANAEPLARWMGAKLLVEQSRPVELRKGLITGGRAIYREHNTGTVGAEELGTFPATNEDQHLCATVEALARLGQVLVFVPDRVRSRKTAELLARHLHLGAAQGAIDELGLLEDGFATSALPGVLSSGIGFHNADLTFDHRDILERHFKSGGIQVMVSTSTLAVGVNYPVATVLIPFRWKWNYKKQGDKWAPVDLTTSEFENMAGRAGRLGLSDRFGRALLLAPSPWHQKVWMRTLIDGPQDPIRATLRERPLIDTVLELVAANAGTNEHELGEFLLSTFTGFLHWAPAGAPQFREQLVAVVNRLLDLKLLRRKSDVRLEVTKVGRIAAERGLSARSAHIMIRWALRAADAPYHPLEPLYAISATQEARDVFISLASSRGHGGYVARFRDAIDRLEHSQRLRESFESKLPTYTDDDIKGLKKALILADWLDERKTEVIEQDHQTFEGAIRHLATDYAWLVDAMSDVTEAIGWKTERVAELRELGRRLRHGVRAELLPLADLGIRGLGRARLRKLADSSLGDTDRLRAADVEQLASVLRHRGVALQIHAALTLGAAAAVPVAPEAPSPAEGPCEGARRMPAGLEAIPTTCPVDSPAAPVAPVPETGAPLPRRLAITTRYLKRKRQCSIEVDARELPLTIAAFVLLLRLALAKKRGEGTVHKQFLGAKSDYGWKGIVRLRQQLGELATLIEKDGAGCYGLGLDPDRIYIDLADLAKHPCKIVREAVQGLLNVARA